MAGLVDFQDEEQVKSFLENMEVECNYQCYREKDPDGCYRLVDYLEGIQKNFDEAAKVLKFNCEENKHSDSCYKLGAYYVTGKDHELLEDDSFILCSLCPSLVGELFSESLMKKMSFQFSGAV